MRSRSALINGTNSIRRRPRRSDTVFKVIVAVEILFLVFMWTVVPDKIQSFGLREHFSTFREIEKPCNKSQRRRQEAQQRNSHHWFFGHRFSRHNKNDMHHNNNMQHFTPKEPTLVIGGSDGSGTRAIAATIQQLGVHMKMDDRETLDVWAPPRSGGWARLVNMVLNTTHCINYELDDLPNETRQVLNMLLNRFWGEIKRFGRSAENRQPVVKMGVFAGFKAPATMVLLPLLKEVIGPIKYLHVVRDGRDIALSKNQSPVQKFYRSMYIDAEDRIARHANCSEAVLAMNLWNDWNTQSLQWLQAHANDDGFEVLVVRSEDMLSPDTKLDTLARLAAFVGSPINEQALCDMGQRDAIDLGQSKSWNRDKDAKTGGVKGEIAKNNVNMRYGKWKHMLKYNPELSAKLHTEGARGLKLFGYEPQRSNVLVLGSSQVVPQILDTSKCDNIETQ